MAFPTKIIPITDAFKTWLNNTFAPKSHSHSNYLTAAQAAELLDPAAGMPDFTRIVFMETPGEVYGENPGTIYKINVPGYIFVDSTYTAYADEVDYWYVVASHPGYLSRHYSQDGAYGSYARPSYESKRVKLYGSVDGSYYINQSMPIIPGTSTYLRCCNASSHPNITKVCFVPIKGLPTSYSKSNYFTRCARGENQIASEGANTGGSMTSLGSTIFAGDWRNNFKSNYSLDTSKILYPKITYRTSGNWMNGWRFHLCDPCVTGDNRVWFTTSGTYIMCKYQGVWRICHHTDKSIYYMSDTRGTGQADPPNGSTWTPNTARLSATYNLTTTFIEPTSSANCAY